MQSSYTFTRNEKEIVVFSCSNCGNFPTPRPFDGSFMLACKCGKHVIGDSIQVRRGRYQYADVVEAWNDSNEDCE